MIKKCRQCGGQFEGRGRYCFSCDTEISARIEAEHAPIREIAKKLGLIENPTVFLFSFPPDMGPAGFENTFGVIGFHAVMPVQDTKWPGFYYQVCTWDCPEGTENEYPLTGIEPWEMITLSR